MLVPTPPTPRTAPSPLLQGAVVQPNQLAIVTQFIPRGSLFRILHRSKTDIDPKRRLALATDIAKGERRCSDPSTCQCHRHFWWACLRVALLHTCWPTMVTLSHYISQGCCTFTLATRRLCTETSSHPTCWWTRTGRSRCGAVVLMGSVVWGCRDGGQGLDRQGVGI